MTISHKKYSAIISTLFSALSVLAASQAFAFDNKATQLTEKKVGETSVVAFKGVALTDEDAMYIDVPHTFVSGTKEISLIQTGSGGNACPAEYFFVMIEGNQAKLSPSIGNCSDIPKITKTDNGQKVVLDFPKFNSAPKVSYTLENGVLKENNKKVLPWSVKTAK